MKSVVGLQRNVTKVCYVPLWSFMGGENVEGLREKVCYVPLWSFMCGENVEGLREKWVAQSGHFNECEFIFLFSFKLWCFNTAAT